MVCGSEIVYLDRPERGRCWYCGEEHPISARCAAGHYVCDSCHRSPAEAMIERFWTESTSTDPIGMAIDLLQSPLVAMHGPEHHYLVPAVLLAAASNREGVPTEAKAARLKKARQRAGMVKGGFCGMLGDCGAAVGTGIFVSVLLGATPLSAGEWQLANLAAAESLNAIALAGGPRCCKRNTMIALRTAIGFARDRLGIDLAEPQAWTCTFSSLNRECRQEECAFYGGGRS